MNPVIKAVDDGHFIKSHDKGKAIKHEEIANLAGKCRKDGEEWPCETIIVAREEHRQNLRRAKNIDRDREVYRATRL